MLGISFGSIWTDCRTRIEAVAEETNRKYLGGAGYAARLLYDELKPGADPLSPKIFWCSLPAR